MPGSSRRNDTQSDTASIGGNSLATNSSSNSSTTASTSTSRRSKCQPAKRGSFASATASSLARGGPDTKCPAARSASAGRMALPKSSSSVDDSGGSGEKENAENQNGDSASAAGGSSTPSKASKEEDTMAPVLSPTPYWKVLEERGNRTSPRTTRSAAKKASQEQSDHTHTMGIMRELDELDPNDKSSDGSSSSEDEQFDPMTLHFSPPDKQLHAAMAKNKKKRQEAELRKENIRAQKVRKAGMMIMDNTNFSKQKRGAKRPKKGHASLKSEENNEAPNGHQAAAANGPSTEEMRQIMQQSLAEHNSHRIEELVAKSAAAERDAAHYKQRYEELEEKYNLLDAQVRAKEGSESELSTRCVEQKGLIDGYVQRILELECEMKELEERHVNDREEDRDVFDAEKKRMEDELAMTKEEHAMELQKVLTDGASIKKLCGEMNDRYNDVQAELESTQAKLTETIQSKEELDALRTSGDESREELLGRVAELQREEAEMTTRLSTVIATSESNENEIASLQSDVTTHLATISNNENDIEQLESNLQKTTKDLEDANRKMNGMQSPRSRDAKEQGFNEEVDELESKMSTIAGEKTDLQEQLREKDEENQVIQRDLDEVQVQNEELQTQLTESNNFVEEAKTAAATMTSENDHLSQQVLTVNTKYDENERQLEEIAVENEQLLAKLESTEVELQQQIQEVGSAAQQREAILEAKCATVVVEKESLDMELRQAQSDNSELQARVSNLEEELTKSQQVTSTLQMEKEASDQKLTELSSQLQTLTNHLESAQATIAALESKLRAKDEYCEQFSSIEKKLIQEKRVLNDIRRDLHNRVIQLSGNIRVFVRVRPLIESERQLQVKQQQQQSTSNNRRLTTNGPSSSSGRPSSRGSMAPSSGGRPSSRGSMMTSSSSHRSLSSTTQPHQGDEMTAECPFHFPSITDRNTNASSSASFNDLTKQTIELTEPYKDRGGLNPRRKKWKYGFDRVFHQDDRQDDVWEGAEPLVQSCVDGFHVCMFAYGQTGSGKTHTMIGDAQNRGLIPRAVEKLFAAKQEIEQSRGGEVSVDIRVELLEVYNEEVRDLLDDNAGPQGQLIKLKLSDNEAVGNVKVTARDEKEVEGILQLAQERRCVKATKSNAESSRSHLLFTIHFDVSSTSTRDDDSATIRSGCLHIVDLAGSERLDKSGSHGALLTEAKHINTSLSALALVIEKLQAKKSSTEHIPYRDSRLTYLLRNSLGGDSKTLAIICCSPHQAHFNESLNSIRFAAKASKVELKESNKVDV
eukprot:CAMPEP_0201922158 /NCGR_PEP_ID=MMETSP0903-20130614/10260_1 /ASSEMBLY_ACC=CAM_ASM_000552 /TAXON_ID=420261 /ORGANISM="Thalassiosira antarctica, Strain CCMP982" /LENGTH=1269 /DNA_ID=CAMNT_0048459237 /DNA_START=92 /DNA_END=3901 /DNA_ORIENTATION=-